MKTFKKNKKSLKQGKVNILIIVFLVVFAIFGLGIGIYVLMENNKEKSESSIPHSECNGDFLHCSMDKPIIYFYPKKETELTVKLGKPEKITASYPAYKNKGWHVLARPDGSLTDLDTGRNLYSLYWEGINNDDFDFSEGFVVSGNDTISFLEEKLSLLGLTEREAEEFIVYWLPKMQDNPYNLIRFESLEKINEEMPLSFSVEPDTLIRILMVYKPLNSPIEIKEQSLPETPARTGFTVVEWGGSEIK